MTRWSRSKSNLPLWLNAYADWMQHRLAAAKLASAKNAPADETCESRVYRRLKETSLRDRLFYTLRQRRRDRLAENENQPSQLTQRLQTQSRHRQYQRGLAAATLSLGLGGAAWTGLFVSERVTLGGVPYGIVETFWTDKTARDAYFSGDTQALHDQLSDLGVEEAIKAYYRDQFDNEHELDRYIHQIMFNRTGYIGEAYQVNNQGQLY